MTTNSGQEHAGEGVARYEAAGYEYGGMCLAPEGRWVSYTDYRNTRDKLLTDRSEARAAADHWKEYAQTRIDALEAENARLRDQRDYSRGRDQAGAEIEMELRANHEEIS